jgi:hypothetical protein
VYCADADQTGRTATANWGTRLLRKHGRESLVTLLPSDPNGEKVDPDVWMRTHDGPEALYAFMRPFWKNDGLDA